MSAARRPARLGIIAFDLGKNLAWVSNHNGRLHSGCDLFEGDRPTRAAAVLKHLQKVFAAFPGLDIAVYETPFARGLYATRSLWGIAGLIEACATNAGLAVVDVSVATIKKFASERGNAAKNDMVKAARSMGYDGINEHVADAFCLLRYAEANLERVVIK